MAGRWWPFAPLCEIRVLCVLSKTAIFSCLSVNTRQPRASSHVGSHVHI